MILTTFLFGIIATVFLVACIIGFCIVLLARIAGGLLKFLLYAVMLLCMIAADIGIIIPAAFGFTSGLLCIVFILLIVAMFKTKL